MKTTFALAMALVAAAIPALAADAPPPPTAPEPVLILGAAYSAGDDYADVTERVKTLIRTGEIFHASPDSLLIDPRPWLNKSLVIVCEIQGKRAIFSTGESQEVSRDLLLAKSRFVGTTRRTDDAKPAPPATAANIDHWDNGGHAWNFRNPGGDSTVLRNDKSFTVTVPGTLHHMFLGGDNAADAPNCLTPMSGDFEAQIKVSGNFDPGAESAKGFSKAIHSAGILVWQDKDHYVRFERGESVTQGSGEHLYAHPLVQQNLDGTYEEYLGPMAAYAPVLTESATDLRLVRKGDRMHAYVSRDDGRNWKEISDFDSLKGPNVSVGVSVVNTSAQEFKATFEGLSVKPAGN